MYLESISKLNEFVLGQHVQLAALPHVDPEFVSLAEYLVVVLGFDASDLILKDSHEYFTSDILLA